MQNIQCSICLDNPVNTITKLVDKWNVEFISGLNNRKFFVMFI